MPGPTCQVCLHLVHSPTGLAWGSEWNTGQWSSPLGALGKNRGAEV